MNKNKHFSITHIQVRPYYFSNKSALLDGERHETPLWDDRNDFMLFPNQNYLAVRLNFPTPHHRSSTPHPAQPTVAISLVDSTANRVVSSDECRISRPKNSYAPHVCHFLPFCYHDINPLHNYCLVVRNARTSMLYATKQVRFFAMPEIRMVPTKWYTAISASLRLDEVGNEEDWLSLDPDLCRKASVRFSLKVNHRQVMERLPELGFRISLPDGSEITRLGKPEQNEGDLQRGKDYCHVDCPLTFFSGEKGVYYIDLCCMAYTMAGFLLPIDDQQVLGKISGKDLTIVKDFHPDGAASAKQRIPGEILPASGDTTDNSDKVQADEEEREEESSDDFERKLNELFNLS